MLREEAATLVCMLHLRAGTITVFTPQKQPDVQYHTAEGTPYGTLLCPGKSNS